MQEVVGSSPTSSTETEGPRCGPSVILGRCRLPAQRSPTSGPPADRHQVLQLVARVACAAVDVGRMEDAGQRRVELVLAAGCGGVAAGGDRRPVVGLEVL